MAYDEKLADRIRLFFEDFPNVYEKKMMGGLVFMYNDKMCVGIIKDELMCRVAPELHESLVEKMGCRTMEFTKKPMIGYVLIDNEGMKTKKDFEYWMNLAVEFNPIAKASKPKPKTKK